MRNVLRVAALGGAIGIVAACRGGTETVPPGTSTSSSGSSGSSSSGASGSGTSSSGTSGTTSSSGSTTSGGPAVTCPTATPAGACPREGLECEYGVDPRPDCRVHAECTNGAWVVDAPECLPLPPAKCPAKQEDASGKECTPKDAVCDYAGTLCECTNCTKYPVQQCSGPITWRCEAPPAAADCPSGRPRLGTTCTKEGALCVYGCEPNMSRTCKGGNWAAASSLGGCPRSTRKVKTDIHYLSDDERSTLADEARSLKLTTWRYVGKLDDGRTHVGYILEDAPAAPASNMKREEVDLYAYTSMTLALAQQQQREIDELKRELRELKKSRR